MPDAFFKISAAEVNGEPEMRAVIMDQDITGRRQLRTLVETVDEVEEVTGIEFFHELNDTLEDDAESSPPHSMWETNRFLVPQFDGVPRDTRTRDCD